MRKFRAGLYGWRQTPKGRWTMFVVIAMALVVLVVAARATSGWYLALFDAIAITDTERILAFEGAEAATRSPNLKVSCRTRPSCVCTAPTSSTSAFW